MFDLDRGRFSLLLHEDTRNVNSKHTILSYRLTHGPIHSRIGNFLAIPAETDGKKRASQSPPGFLRRLSEITEHYIIA